MNIPSAKRYYFNPKPSKPLLTGLDRIIDRAVAKITFSKRNQSSLFKECDAINLLIEQYNHYSNEQLSNALASTQSEFQRNQSINTPHLRQAVALISIASERTLGLKPYPVQLMSVIAMYNGYLVEMETGEGKTLVSGLASVLYAWHKHPCHVLTANDYLAKRDMEYVKPLHEFCHVSISCVLSDTSQESRHAHYQADIVYTTSQELLADYLRDQIKLKDIDSLEMYNLCNAQQSLSLNTTVSRGIHSVIIDEADSILIDQAVSPLLISNPVENALLTEAVTVALQYAGQFTVDQDYHLERAYQSIILLPSAKLKIKKLGSELPKKWQGEKRQEELLIQALTAREYYIKGKHYVIQEGKVVIVDEFTGRLMPNRNWGLGLHQAIEAKESVEITPPNETINRMSFQNFFRLFNRKCGMTGTAQEALHEFWDIYKLPIAIIPRNLPSKRKVLKTHISTTKDQKWSSIITFVKQTQALGQAILIGTRTVQESEVLAEQFSQAGLQFQLLNANHSEQEAQIISKAGQSTCITIATNMAGRGTDIILDETVTSAGGLCVIMTEHHNSKRIDRQLIGRSARQGDAGSCRVFLSLEDELIVDNISNTVLTVFGSKYIAKYLFKFAQTKAEKTSYLQRQAVLKNDFNLNESLSFVK